MFVCLVTAQIWSRYSLGRVIRTACQLAEQQGSIAEAVLQIRGAAGGRKQLLVQGGGLGLGAWSVNPELPSHLLGAALLIGSVERLELDVLSYWIATGQQRGLSGARHRA